MKLCPATSFRASSSFGASMAERKEKFSEELRVAIGRYLAQESNRTSLLTVTRIDVSPDLKNALVYLSVFPEEKEKPALAFLKRNLTDLRDFIKYESRLPRIPTLSVIIDQGEKNRQHMDALVERDKKTNK